MAVTSQSPGPYAPSSAVLAVIERYRQRGLATPISADVLARAGVSNTLIPRTLQALVTLELIDDKGGPTPNLEKIRSVPESEYKQTLAEWIRLVYDDVLSFVDPGKDDDVRIRDAFRAYQPLGQQDRMVSLFKGLCSAAGLLPESEGKAAAPRKLITPRGAYVPARSKHAASSKTPPPPGNTTSSLALPVLPAPLVGILQSIPASTIGWTKDDREKFLKTFEVVLDFVVPVVTKPIITNGDDKGDEADD